MFMRSRQQHSATGYEIGRAAQQQMTGISFGDVQGATGDINTYIATDWRIDAAKVRKSRCTCTGAAAQRLAHTTLEDAHCDVVLTAYRDELDIGTLVEDGCRSNSWRDQEITGIIE
jgi:hypothetical protein